MILENVEIEFSGVIPNKIKNEIKEKINANIEKIQFVGMKIIGDENITLHDIANYAGLLQEELNDDTQVLLGVIIDKNYVSGQRKLQITISDNKNDLQEEKYTVNV